MRFYYIFWLTMAMSMSISFTNALGIFTTNYMSAPAGGSTYAIGDIEGTLNTTTPTDDSDLSTGGFLALLSFIKDMAINTFAVYKGLIQIWHVPAALAAVLQAIVAVSWAVFFIQLFSRFPWGGTEG